MGGRYRMIKPDFWEDEKIAQLSDKAKLLFIALWNFADDEGLLENNTKWIKIKCFPYEKNIKIEKYLSELLQISLISEKNGIYRITNFLKHQKIKKPTPSKLAKKWGTSGEQVENQYSPLNKEKLKEVKERKEKENGETPEPLFNSEKQNDTATANDNGQNCDDNATPSAVPQEFKPLVDYLTSQGYSDAKAKLVANLRQSINWTLTTEHIKIFSEQSEDEIKKSFEILSKTFKKRDKSAGFTTFADSKV